MSRLGRDSIGFGATFVAFYVAVTFNGMSPFTRALFGAYVPFGKVLLAVGAFFVATGLLASSVAVGTRLFTRF